ncbi:hypothetical protein AKJ09_04735 [Labilithrix luteola]|uniref:Anti sigma-E protein RseA N-terminal domain-containing protein n=1 Tax=Labilithrix luteola TaxID=1391654 RepID=A0A0K1PXF4_9BACT|nr:hypothetical protein [Labilithrix luteola]AKU98071.1 hypothetical protein AKJ09_04735 [Labilithrix luteola]
MTLSSDNMLKLMAYADGELAGDDLTEVEKLLATDADAVRFVNDIANLGDFVQEGHATRAGGAIASFDIADAVMAKIAAEPKAAPAVKAEPAAVTSLAAERAKRSRRTQIAGGVAAALALAAALFLVARPQETPMAPAPVAVNASEPSNAPVEVDVTATDTPGQSVSVFYLPAANEVTTSVVVWVDETGAK